MRTWSRYAYTALTSAVLAFALGVIYLKKDEAAVVSRNDTMIPRALPQASGKPIRNSDPFRALRGLALADETVRLKAEESLVLRRLNGEKIEDLIDLTKPSAGAKRLAESGGGRASAKTAGGIREVILRSDFQDNDLPASSLEHIGETAPAAASRRDIPTRKLASVPDASNSENAGGEDSAFVSVERAGLWSGPGRGNSLIASARKYSRVSVELRSGDWYRVQMPSGLRAWIESADIRFAGNLDSPHGGTGSFSAAAD